MAGRCPGVDQLKGRITETKKKPKSRPKEKKEKKLPPKAKANAHTPAEIAKKALLGVR